MFTQTPHDRRRFLGLGALSLAGAWIGTRDPVMHMITMKPFRSSSASGLASLSRATAWLNSSPLTPAALQGKVVLVNFWTYTCINWLRTLPHVRGWTARYKERGLVVIGVHTPEFSFEENVDNVRKAAQERGVTYPIAIDNDRAIWNGFGNHYWPALYFIDASGRVRDHHFGEGNYEQLEMRIQTMLAAAGNEGRIDRASVSFDALGPEVAADWDNLKSPETYVGHYRAENFISPGGVAKDTRHLYAVPPVLRLNQWALSGEWTVKAEAAVLHAAGGRIAFRFHARDVHLVMGPSRQGAAARFRVTIDGQPPANAHGGDIDAAGNGTADEQRLYQLIRQPKPIVDRLFEIEFADTGVEVFAFTFG